MLKRILILTVCAVTAIGPAVYSPPAEAVAPGWYFFTACSIPNPRDCPGGPRPATFGPYPSAAQCEAAAAIIATGPWGRYPRSISNCFLQ